MLQFNWGVFWAILAALAARVAFKTCWFALAPKMFFSMEDRVGDIQDQLKDVASNVREIKNRKR